MLASGSKLAMIAMINLMMTPLMMATGLILISLVVVLVSSLNMNFML